MCLVRPSQRGRDDLTQSDRVHLDLRAWTLEIPPMRIPTLLPLLDRLPSDPYTHLGLPAALAPRLTPMQRAARHPQSWTEYRLLTALTLTGWSFRYSLAHADALAHGIDPIGGQYKRAFRQLTQAGLWEEARVRVTVHAVLVRLTPLGHSLLTKIGLTPVESEWERTEQMLYCVKWGEGRVARLRREFSRTGQHDRLSPFHPQRRGPSGRAHLQRVDAAGSLRPVGGRARPRGDGHGRR